MKRFIAHLLLMCLLTFLIFETVILGIICFPKERFHTSYQSIIQDKYRILKNTEEKKIILIGGSSLAFGLDQDMLERSTGYKVVNLGVHASFSPMFPTELSKENINPGDIVLLGYEHNWITSFDDMSQDLVMSGIDDDIEMYKHIPVYKWPEFIGYIFGYAEKKYSYVDATGIYSREAFDSQTGQMVMDREYEMGDPYNGDFYGYIDVKDATIDHDTVEYLRRYRKYVLGKGAEVYFICPPLYEEAMSCAPEDFDRLAEMEEDLIGIKYIDRQRELLFPKEMMSNAKYHCNKEGEKKRTKLLINDLKRIGINTRGIDNNE